MVDDAFTSSDAAAEISITPKRFATLAHEIGIKGFRIGRRTWYTQEDVNSVREEHLKRSRKARPLKEILDKIDVPTAQLRKWYHEDRYQLCVISGWLGICAESMRDLLCMRGIKTQRSQKTRRCGCHRLLDASHPRCPRCGVLICEYLEREHGPGPLCKMCQDELKEILDRATIRRQRPAMLVPGS